MTSAKILSLAGVVATSLAAGSALAQDAGSFERDIYMRLEAGGAFLGQNRGNWTGPGPADPQITHSLSNPGAFFGSVAVGTTVFDGLRTDLSLSYQSRMNVKGQWIAPAAGAPHANMDVDVSSWIVMANVFAEPLALAGYESPIRPFVTGGLGVAFNQMDDWTRTNPAAVQPVRTFEGNTETSFAWSIGGGVSASLGDLFGLGHPIDLDLTYRYIDAGKVQGGGTPLPGSGTSVPREPFNYDNTLHTVSIGVRIPFSTY